MYTYIYICIHLDFYTYTSILPDIPRLVDPLAIFQAPALRLVAACCVLEAMRFMFTAEELELLDSAPGEDEEEEADSASTILLRPLPLLAYQ